MPTVNKANAALKFLEDFTRNPGKYDGKQVEAVFKLRTLADQIECLPDHVNDPCQMPFVQELLTRAFKQVKSDRDLLAKHFERGGDLSQAERLGEPVESIALPDDVNCALAKGFERDESGVFEKIERDAAEIGEWLKEFRHPRDVEKFREYLKSLCDPSGLIVSSIGIEVRPGVFALDLDAWKEAGATPLCRYLRELADEMASEPRTFDLLHEFPTDWQTLRPLVGHYIEKFGGRVATTDPDTPPVPVLSEREEEVDTLIRAEGPLSGKEICNRLGIGEKVLSNHVVPALKKKRGLRNQRSRGYYYPT